MIRRVIVKYLFLVLSIALIFSYIKLQKTYSSQEEVNSPVITFTNNRIQCSVSASQDALLEGVIATDKEDGDLSSQVKIESTSKFVEKNTIRVNYYVFDHDGNVGKASRYIDYTDYTPPQFSMSDDLIAGKYSNDEILSRIHATSSIDGNIDNKITIMNVAQTSTDTIKVKLSVTDSTSTTSYISLNYYVENNPNTIKLSTYLVNFKLGDYIDFNSFIEGVCIGNIELTDYNDSISVYVPEITGKGVYEVVYTTMIENHIAKSILILNVTGGEENE